MAIARPQVTMWDDMENMGSITVATTSTTGIISNTLTTSGANTISVRTSAEEIFDRYSLNEFVVEHRVQEFELMKLRETNVDYADIIKDNLTKMASKEIIKKMTFTKKHEVTTDTHSFRGRVWAFTKEELNQMIEDIRNGV